ncbi:MAG TPA: glycerol kinase GlpK [Clostridia bacterium]
MPDVLRRYILSIDQGTTSSKVMVFDHAGAVVDQASREITQFYPEPGWVEHDAVEIWHTVYDSCAEIFGRGIVLPDEIAAIGITDQRETTTVWDRSTGEPIARAICWQSRQTAPICERLKAKGLEEMVRSRTGLLIDPYFSASKILFLMENVPGAAERAARGELAFGTVDCWLMYNLSGKKAHVTDYTNASRTLLLDIHKVAWDDGLIDGIGVERSLLPELKPSSGMLCMTDPEVFFGQEIPISGVAGDQHAATFGQACFEPGMAKNTYGTSLALFMNTGPAPVVSRFGLTTDLGWVLGGRTEYALEGVVFVGGAAVQWLRDGLGIIKTSRECDELAETVPDTGGLYMVPAFTGLCAPYWDTYARGMMIGITRGTSRAHICRATLESLAYQTRDVIEAMTADSGVHMESLRVDGKATRSEFLMQFQADILGIPVELPAITEMACLGAAYLAGLGVGFWRNTAELATQWRRARLYEPNMSLDQSTSLYAGWKKAVVRSMGWAKE